MLVAIIVPMVLTFFFRKAGLFTKTEDVYKRQRLAGTLIIKMGINKHVTLVYER